MIVMAIIAAKVRVFLVLNAIISTFVA